MSSNEATLYNVASACGVGVGIYGIVEAVKGIDEGRGNEQETLFLGLNVIANAVTCAGLLKQGTRRERVTYLAYLITGGIAFLLSLISLTTSEKMSWEGRTLGKESIYVLCVVVGVVGLFLSWRIISSLTSSSSSFETETTSSVYWTGLIITLIWLGTGIWSGVGNVREEKPNLTLTILLVISLVASLLRVPLFLSDQSTSRERIRFFFMILLECTGLFLNLFSFRTNATYVACSVVVLAVVVVEILLGRKIGILPSFSFPPSLSNKGSVKKE